MRCSLVSDTSVCFITPAYQRYNLSRICLEQRRDACDKLKELGIHADCVVVADDENLEIAKSFGFHTIDTPNDYLGRKFNEGHEFACKSGYTHVIPAGSDMFIDPNVISSFDQENKFTTTVFYAIMNQDGNKFIKFRLDWGILQIIPVSMLSHVDSRPCIDTIAVGCDTYTRKRTAQKLREPILRLIGHSLECISFQSAENQITRFQKFEELPETVVMTGPTGWLLEPLKTYYPESLVEKARNYYTSGQSLGL